MIMVFDYDLRLTIYDLRCPWDVPGKQWISMKIGGQAWISVSMDIYCPPWCVFWYDGCPPPPLMVHWCGGPMMCVLILPGGRAGSWAVQYQGWWPRVMRAALPKVLREHVEMLKCKQIITPEEYRIRFRVLYSYPT